MRSLQRRNPMSAVTLWSDLQIKPRVAKPIRAIRVWEPSFRMLALTVRQVDAAVDDLSTGIRSWRLSHLSAIDAGSDLAATMA
jgi:hypothetical protein